MSTGPFQRHSGPHSTTHSAPLPTSTNYSGINADSMTTIVDYTEGTNVIDMDFTQVGAATTHSTAQGTARVTAGPRNSRQPVASSPMSIQTQHNPTSSRTSMVPLSHSTGRNVEVSPASTPPADGISPPRQPTVSTTNTHPSSLQHSHDRMIRTEPIADQNNHAINVALQRRIKTLEDTLERVVAQVTDTAEIVQAMNQPSLFKNRPIVPITIISLLISIFIFYWTSDIRDLFITPMTLLYYAHLLRSFVIIPYLSTLS